MSPRKTDMGVLGLDGERGCGGTDLFLVFEVLHHSVWIGFVFGF